MSITFNQTARDVVIGAMRDLAIIAPDDVPTAAEFEYGIEHINLMLKDLAQEGVFPWANLTGTATILANTNTVTLSPDPVEVSFAEIDMPGSYGYTRQLFRWSEGDYEALPTKRQKGLPIKFDTVRTVGGTALRVWPTPTTDTVVTYNYSRMIEDVVEGQVLDVPQEWGMAIRAMLKEHLTAYGPIPPEVVMKAQMARQKIIDAARPESYRMQGFI